MAITEDALHAANQRGMARKAAFPVVVSAHYDAPADRVVLALSSGLELAFAPRRVQGLEHATPADLADAEISPAGLGVHFPHVDADLYVPALLEGFLGSRRWMAAQNGKLGGSVTSAAKASAARRNGRLGGRPKKATPSGG